MEYQALGPEFRGKVLYEGRDREHCLWVERDWSATIAHETAVPYVLFIGAHPSLCPYDRSDLILLRAVEITRRLQCARLFFANAITWRMNYREAPPGNVDLCHRSNWAWIRRFVEHAQEVVVCFGRPHALIVPYAKMVLHELMVEGIGAKCVGYTATGAWPMALGGVADAQLHPYRHPKLYPTASAIAYAH